jgi:hypothetical protein
MRRICRAGGRDKLCSVRQRWLTIETALLAQLHTLAVMKPHPPIHVGGAFPHGARRAIRYGDGWIPTARGDLTVELPKFRQMAQEVGRDPNSLEITSFGLGEDLDRVKRLSEMGLSRVVQMFPPEQADTVLPIIDRWAKIMQQANA